MTTNNIYKCNICNYVSNNKSNVNRHILNKHKTDSDSESDTNTDSVIETKNISETEKTFLCEKCNKKYKTKKHFDNHNKKCVGIDILTCPKCMKKFSTTSNKSKHIKKNNCVPKSIIYSNNIINNNNTNNSHNNSNNTINNNIYINNYGSERTDYITIDDILEIINKNSNIISKYIELKHFNNNFPENCNIKFIKNKACNVKNNNKWELHDIDELSKNMCSKNASEIYKLVNSNNNEIKEKIKNIEIYENMIKNIQYLDLELNLHNIKSIKTLIKIYKQTL